MNTFSCAYWLSAWKWPPWDGVPRTGDFQFFQEWMPEIHPTGEDCALLMGHSGLRPTRFHCNEASNSRQMERTMAFWGLWGVKVGGQAGSTRLISTRRGLLVSESTDSKPLEGYGRWLTQMKRLGPLPIWLLSHFKLNLKKVDVIELNPWGLWDGF